MPTSESVGRYSERLRSPPLPDAVDASPSSNVSSRSIPARVNVRTASTLEPRPTSSRVRPPGSSPFGPTPGAIRRRSGAWSWETRGRGDRGTRHASGGRTERRQSSDRTWPRPARPADRRPHSVCCSARFGDVGGPPPSRCRRRDRIAGQPTSPRQLSAQNSRNQSI
jgi:hypothetical protein